MSSFHLIYEGRRFVFEDNQWKCGCPVCVHERKTEREKAMCDHDKCADKSGSDVWRAKVKKITTLIQEIDSLIDGGIQFESADHHLFLPLIFDGETKEVVFFPCKLRSDSETTREETCDCCGECPPAPQPTPPDPQIGRFDIASNQCRNFLLAHLQSRESCKITLYVEAKDGQIVALQKHFHDEEGVTTQPSPLA